jgi:hypothetical protein
MVEADVAVMRQRSNRAALRAALLRCGCTCDNWDAVSITDCQLTRREIEQVVGVAAAQQLLAESPAGAAEVEEPAGATTGALAAAAASKGTQPADPVPAAAKNLSDADSLAAAPALALERSGSVCVAPATGAAAAPAPVAAEQRGQQQQQPSAAAPGAKKAALAASDQAAAMQTDDVDGGTAVAAAVPISVPDAAEKVAPLWTLAAEHIMHAAEAIRKVQAEGAAAPANKLALKDVAADQYEKQLLSEVRCLLVGGLGPAG